MQPQHKTEVLNRMKSIQGHLRGVQRMVEEDQYCIDIIKQTMAVQKAIEKVNSIILENHLQTCVARALRGDSPDDRERVISELLQLYEGGVSIGLNRHIQEPPADGSVAAFPASAASSGHPTDGTDDCPHCGATTTVSGGIEE